MDRNHLEGRDGDRASAVLTVEGYHFSRLLRWLRLLLRQLLRLLNSLAQLTPA